MGQKAKGYRRGAMYGAGTARRGERDQWIVMVNPPGQAGWSKMGAGSTSRGHGRSEGRAEERRKRMTQIRRAADHEVGTRGRLGDSAAGYMVVGEYVRLGDFSFPRRERERLVRGYSGFVGLWVGVERVDRSQRVRELGCRGERRKLRGRGGASSRLVVGRAMVIVLSGYLRRESLLGVRVVRSREVSGLGHKKARRLVAGVLLAHATYSPHGLVRGGRSGGSGYYGYRVVVTGPLGGSRRTKSHVFGCGVVPESRKRGLFGEWEGVACTSVGTLGVRVVYTYGLG